MVKTLTIVGARPQFIKAAPVIKLLDNDILVHTGQHYDDNMSNIFFEGLSIKEPDYNLDVGSGSHNYMVTTMMQKLEDVIKLEKPDTVIVYGDTNSTLAGAVIAKEMGIRLVHVEAGLRSYNMSMPEERNRIITDKLSDVLLCPTTNAYHTLAKEMLHTNAQVVGDTMYDLLMENGFFLDKSKLAKWDLMPKSYYLCTLHRPVNVDNLDKLKIIFDAFGELDKDVLFPCHPRTQKKLNYIFVPENVQIIDPVGYFDMMTLAVNADKILTDSGGLQKEAHMLEVPCVTLRDETEWIESVECGANKLCKINKADIIATINSEYDIETSYTYGDGDASKKIVKAICEV